MMATTHSSPSRTRSGLNNSGIRDTIHMSVMRTKNLFLLMYPGMFMLKYKKKFASYAVLAQRIWQEDGEAELQAAFIIL